MYWDNVAAAAATSAHSTAAVHEVARTKWRSPGPPDGERAPRLHAWRTRETTLDIEFSGGTVAAISRASVRGKARIFHIFRSTASTVCVGGRKGVIWRPGMLNLSLRIGMASSRFTGPISSPSLALCADIDSLRPAGE